MEGAEKLKPAPGDLLNGDDRLLVVGVGWVGGFVATSSAYETKKNYRGAMPEL